ncbi:MAG: YciI family protein [Trebonia sp.]
MRDGQLIVTDGPYAETKEQVAGYDVIECASLEEAVRWAGRHPHSWMGAVEVRALVGGAPAVHLPEPSAGRCRYMMLVCTDPAAGPQESARVEPAGPWAAEMAGRGIRLFGSALEPPGAARTVRVREKRAIVTDGPVRRYERADRRLRRT